MTTDVTSDRAPAAPAKFDTGGRRMYYGWICVGAAALAMVATLPGRTIGLGLVTEPLLRDAGLGRTTYAAINGWATVLGAGFGLVTGKLLDRFGARVVTSVLALLLGVVVMSMTRVTGAWGLLVAVTLTRGLGQSALSAASVALVGKWFGRRVGYPMAVYSVLLSVGFMIAIPTLEAVTRSAGWRAAWGGMGLALAAVVAPLLWITIRDAPRAAEPAGDNDAPVGALPRVEPAAGRTLRQALATPAFWALAGGGFVFSAAYSGVTLFNASVLGERGLAAAAAGALVVMAFTGLASNFLAGWLASRPGASMTRLMGAAMALLGASLLALPHVRTASHVYAYAAAIGVSAGAVTVVFFACWSKLYGRAHLGKIQGAAQALTVLGSAAGPWALAESQRQTGSYAAVFYACALLAGAVGAACVLLPSARGETE